jgi:hypothetical protein
MLSRSSTGVRTSLSPDGNFNFAARALWREFQVDSTTEFVRNEIADEA